VSAARSQLSLALALVDLLREAPEVVGRFAWSIDRFRRTLPPALEGYAGSDDVADLEALAAMIGGVPQVADRRPWQDRHGAWLQTWELRVTWRDVPIEASVHVPVTSVVAA
jgi:hypothetical protein